MGIKKRVKLPVFDQYFLGTGQGAAVIITTEDYEKLPEPLKERAARVTAVSLMTAALDTPSPGSNGFTPGELIQRAKVEAALSAAKGKYVDLEPAQYTLIKTLFSITPWTPRHRVFADMFEAIEAATDIEEKKEVKDGPAD